jgi:signal transduction histidine kinase
LTVSALETTDELRGLLGQLAGIETRERSVLAEVIHDEPIQLIVAAILRIDLMHSHSTGDDAVQLDAIATLLESSVDRLRRLIVALSPPDLSEGLGGALHALADGIFVEATTQFHITGELHAHLAVPAVQTVFRIFREAMVNARKHSVAGNVTLHLEQRDEVFVVTLTDDGIGSDGMDADLGHLGTATMRATARAEGGQLRIESKPGHGTIVELTLPSDRAVDGD